MSIHYVAENKLLVNKFIDRRCRFMDFFRRKKNCLNNKFNVVWGRGESKKSIEKIVRRAALRWKKESMKYEDQQRREEVFVCLGDWWEGCLWGGQEEKLDYSNFFWPDDENKKTTLWTSFQVKNDETCYEYKHVESLWSHLPLTSTTEQFYDENI